MIAAREEDLFVVDFALADFERTFLAGAFFVFRGVLKDFFPKGLLRVGFFAI